MKTPALLTKTLMAMLLLAAFASAQIVGGTVRGKVTDEQGQPMPNAIVRFQNSENGRKYDLKTNAKGEYLQVGVQLGSYDCVLLGPDSKPLFTLHGIRPDPNDDTVIDIDLKQERERSQGAAGAQGAQGAQPPAQQGNGSPAPPATGQQGQKGKQGQQPAKGQQPPQPAQPSKEA